MGDAPPVVLTKDEGERTVYLAEVERLHFHKSQLEPLMGNEQRAVAGIADFNCAEESYDLFSGGRVAIGRSIYAHEPTGPLPRNPPEVGLERPQGRDSNGRKTLSGTQMLGGQSSVPGTQAVVDHKYTQVLVGQKQQLRYCIGGP